MLDNPAVIVAAAASGDVGTLKEFLRKHPSQVCNAFPSVVHVLKSICIVEMITALHSCVYVSAYLV